VAMARPRCRQLQPDPETRKVAKESHR
jgi:hypothetical protein